MSEKGISRLISLVWILLAVSLLLFFASIWYIGSKEERFVCGTASMIKEEVPSIDHPAKELPSKGEILFKENCTSCHSVQTVEVGPALYGVTKKRKKKWLYQFVRNPYVLLQRKDTVAIHVFEQFNHTPHTTFESFTDQELQDLFQYISEQPQSLPALPDIGVID